MACLSLGSKFPEFDKEIVFLHNPLLFPTFRSYRARNKSEQRRGTRSARLEFGVFSPSIVFPRFDNACSIMPATREISIKRGIASIRSRKEKRRKRKRGFLRGEKKFSRHCRERFSSITFRFSLSIVPASIDIRTRDNFIQLLLSRFRFRFRFRGYRISFQ